MEAYEFDLVIKLGLKRRFLSIFLSELHLDSVNLVLKHLELFGINALVFGKDCLVALFPPFVVLLEQLNVVLLGLNLSLKRLHLLLERFHLSCKLPDAHIELCSLAEV